MGTAENDLEWTFDPETGEEEGANDAMGQNFRLRPYASLLREAVQNALDVPASSEPVVVRFQFGKINSRSFPSFFKLKEHIQGCIDYWHNSESIVGKYKRMQECFSDDYSSELCYLKISDRNTLGMDYKPNNNNVPFYAFVRASKVSVKGHDNTGGTYGFGKAAYFQLSPIGTLLVSTMTVEGKCFFEGKSVLCTHTYRGLKKTSVGYYDNNGGKAPIDKVDDIPMRFRREEPGTDFYILGFLDSRREVALEEMKQESLRSFFVAIHRKKLIIELKYSQDYCLSINSGTLPNIMKEVFPETKDTSGQFRTLNPRPYYDAIVNEDNGKQYRTFTDVMPNIGRVYLYIKRDKDISDKLLFMRRPFMTVYPKYLSSSVGISGVFICDDTLGDNKLKKIENSSHTQWRPEINKDPLTQETIEEGKVAFEEVKSFCERCIKELSDTGERQELDISGLEDLLYVPDSLIDESEDEEEKIIGQPTCDFKDTGLSVTTDIQKDEFVDKKTTEKTDDEDVVYGELTGSVILSDDGPDTAGIDQSGQRGTGEGTKKPGTQIRNVEKSESDGILFGPIKVNCRSFAQNEDGIWWHYITIHSSTNIHNGFMDVVVCGEQGDVAVNIAESDKWSYNGNRISKMEIPIGTTRFKIRFTDNMKYTLLTALYYE